MGLPHFAIFGMSVIKNSCVHSMQTYEMVNILNFEDYLFHFIIMYSFQNLQSEKSVGLEARKGAGVLYKKGRGVYYNFKQSLVVPTSIQTVTDLVPKTKTLGEKS